MQKHVIGLPVEDGKVRIEDLVEWIEARDASCAEYLAPALREHLRTGEDVCE